MFLQGLIGFGTQVMLDLACIFFGDPLGDAELHQQLCQRAVAVIDAVPFSVSEM